VKWTFGAAAVVPDRTELPGELFFARLFFLAGAAVPTGGRRVVAFNLFETFAGFTGRGDFAAFAAMTRTDGSNPSPIIPIIPMP
jgi:hypothetical protein